MASEKVGKISAKMNQLVTQDKMYLHQQFFGAGDAAATGDHDACHAILKGLSSPDMASLLMDFLPSAVMDKAPAHHLIAMAWLVFVQFHNISVADTFVCDMKLPDPTCDTDNADTLMTSADQFKAAALKVCGMGALGRMSSAKAKLQAYLQAKALATDGADKVAHGLMLGDFVQPPTDLAETHKAVKAAAKDATQTAYYRTEFFKKQYKCVNGFNPAPTNHGLENAIDSKLYTAQQKLTPAYNALLKFLHDTEQCLSQEQVSDLYNVCALVEIGMDDIHEMRGKQHSRISVAEYAAPKPSSLFSKEHLSQMKLEDKAKNQIYSSRNTNRGGGGSRGGGGGRGNGGRGYRPKTPSPHSKSNRGGRGGRGGRSGRGGGRGTRSTPPPSPKAGK